MYPSTLTAFTRPNATDKLSSPSHSSIHTAISSAVGQIEAVIGTASSTLGTIIGDLRSAASDGGGHIQSTAKGGTGQVAYTKGDLLIAQNASTLSKLAVGTDTQVLKADSSVATGIKWVDSQTGKIATSSSVITVVSTANETSLMSVTVPGSTLGINNAVRATVLIQAIGVDNTDDTVTIRANYGTTSLATILVGSISGGAAAGVAGKFEFNLLANGSVAQRGQTQTLLSRQVFPPSSFFGMGNTRTGVSAEDSSANKIIGVTAQWNNSDPSNTLSTNGYIVEKII
jgi:hypothetical protein